MKLIKADYKDCLEILNMQKIAFEPYLKRYKDYDTNPACESLERIQERFLMEGSTYYFIALTETIGVVRVVDDGESYRISPIFIMPNYQGQGYGYKVIKKLEAMYVDHKHWKLSTIYEEKGLCNFYERLGYVAGQVNIVKAGMHLVYYNKVVA